MSDQVVRSIPGVKWFQDKLKDVKVYGTKHNVPYVQISLINSFFLIFLGSLKVMTLLFVGLDTLSSKIVVPDYAYEIAGYIQIPLWGIMTVTLLPIVSKGMIRIEKMGSKLVFYAVNRIDLILWRKFGVESPVSNRIWNMEQRIRSVSIQSKRKIFILGLGLYGIYALNRLSLL